MSKKERVEFGFRNLRIYISAIYLTYFLDGVFVDGIFTFMIDTGHPFCGGILEVLYKFLTVLPPLRIRGFKILPILGSADASLSGTFKWCCDFFYCMICF